MAPTTIYIIEVGEVPRWNFSVSPLLGMRMERMLHREKTGPMCGISVIKWPLKKRGIFLITSERDIQILSGNGDNSLIMTSIWFRSWTLLNLLISWFLPAISILIPQARGRKRSPSIVPYIPRRRRETMFGSSLMTSPRSSMPPMSMGLIQFEPRLFEHSARGI